MTEATGARHVGQSVSTPRGVLARQSPRHLAQKQWPQPTFTWTPASRQSGHSRAACSRVRNEASDPLDVWAVPTSSSANRAAAFVVRLAPGNETSQLATFGDAFALRRGDAWHLIAETFLTHSEPIAPALALRNRMQEAFGVTHALAPPRQVPPGGAEGWRLQHGEHLLIRDAAENLVASIALDRPQHESHDEI